MLEPNRLELLLDRIATAFEQNNELLTKLLGERQSKTKVLPLSEAWKELGYSNYLQCWRKIQKGHYRIGHEVEDRRSPDSETPEYWLNIQACKERNKVIPAKRSA